MRSAWVLAVLGAVSVLSVGCDATEDVFRDDASAPLPTHRYAGFDASGAEIASGTLSLQSHAEYRTCVGTYQVRITTDALQPTGHFQGGGTVCLSDEPTLPESCVWVLQNPLRLAPFDEVWILEGRCELLPYPESGNWRHRVSGTFLETGTFKIVPVGLPGR